MEIEGMSTKENGGPAFPCVETVLDQDGCDLSVLHHGLSIRDYFAAKATDDDVLDIIRDYFDFDAGFYTVTRQQARYMHADAMLSERAK
jgi:hypothetical protein